MEWNGCKEKKRGGKRRLWRDGKMEYTKQLAPKCNIFGIMRTPVDRYRPVKYIFGKLVSRATFSSQIVRLYLEQFKNYKALNVSQMLKNVNKLNIWPWRGLPSHAIHFRKLLSRAAFHSEVLCVYLKPFKVIGV